MLRDANRHTSRMRSCCVTTEFTWIDKLLKIKFNCAATWAPIQFNRCRCALPLSKSISKFTDWWSRLTGVESDGHPKELLRRLLSQDDLGPQLFLLGWSWTGAMSPVRRELPTASASRLPARGFPRRGCNEIWSLTFALARTISIEFCPGLPWCLPSKR